MYIIEQMNRHQVIRLLKTVKLLGSEVMPYRKSRIIMSAKVEPSNLVPCQNYVLRSQLDKVSEMIEKLSVSPLQLLSSKYCTLGCIKFSSSDGIMSLVPPIIEQWGGKMIIADGMHRIFTAIQRKQLIDIVYVREIDEECPYYALPLPNGWNDVKIVDEKPDIGKVYKEPDNYKRLFRDYNAIFPNVQMKR